MTREKFWNIVEEAVKQLPDEFSTVLDNVEIVVRNYPDKETREKLAPGGLLLGLYKGIPRTARGSGYSSSFYGFTQPDIIHLYQKNIEKYCHATGKSMVGQIKETLLHEIGHYMGLNEEELADLKYRVMKQEN